MPADGGSIRACPVYCKVDHHRTHRPIFSREPDVMEGWRSTCRKLLGPQRRSVLLGRRAALSAFRFEVSPGTLCLRRAVGNLNASILITTSCWRGHAVRTQSRHPRSEQCRRAHAFNPHCSSSGRCGDDVAACEICTFGANAKRTGKARIRERDSPFKKGCATLRIPLDV